ncbi:hypothetical protein Cgig2_003730 [Carnegiea gigantea]|uniref:Uncharacterized protein n=1 Tax=Carnegiea gigantea TaxID=171969 RepID=A0A9Q1KH09_9CARY|nr:hypothetical protein Cgig2_003730 [Carnegiea gigantea]
MPSYQEGPTAETMEEHYNSEVFLKDRFRLHGKVGMTMGRAGDGGCIPAPSPSPSPSPRSSPPPVSAPFPIVGKKKSSPSPSLAGKRGCCPVPVPFPITIPTRGLNLVPVAVPSPLGGTENFPHAGRAPLGTGFSAHCHPYGKAWIIQYEGLELVCSKSEKIGHRRDTCPHAMDEEGNGEAIAKSQDPIIIAPKVISFMEDEVCKTIGFGGVFHVEANGFMGAIWVRWPEEELRLEEISSSHQHATLEVSMKDSEGWLLSAIYGSPNEQQGAELWTDTGEFAQHNSHPWPLVCDFNV